MIAFTVLVIDRFYATSAFGKSCVPRSGLLASSATVALAASEQPELFATELRAAFRSPH